VGGDGESFSEIFIVVNLTSSITSGGFVVPLPSPFPKNLGFNYLTGLNGFFQSASGH
jgi:hypothetical protein